MKLPEFVKRIGTAEGECRVYIEDYVYTYLNELREKKKIFPLRAALFGHVLKKEGKCIYFVYGAASVIDEMENGRDEEQVRREFFHDYDLIGYVNICKDKQLIPDKNKGYYIFYETNEAMQTYLVSCYKRDNCQAQDRAEALKSHRKRHRYSMSNCNLKLKGEMLRRFFYGVGILLLATAVTAINDYERMHGFTETACRAVSFAETTHP